MTLQGLIHHILVVRRIALHGLVRNCMWHAIVCMVRCVSMLYVVQCFGTLCADVVWHGVVCRAVAWSDAMYHDMR